MTASQEGNAPLPAVPSAEHATREGHGVSLHVVAAGEADAPLVVFLHGYPEFWYEWHDYVEPFVDAGYRVLVPDQRGYNRSEKPAGVRSYRITELSRDVVELIDGEGRDSAHVIGHDWGAAVAWDLALRHPETVDRLGIINVPHPSVFEAIVRSNLAQLRRSWYMFLYQVPRVAEWYSRRDDFAFMVETMQKSQPDAFSATDFDRYRRAWSEPGALTATINWYRALFRHNEDPPREEVTAPTALLWGEADHALLPEMAPRSFEYCTDGRLERFPDGSHWVPHEERDRIVEILLEHLAD